MGAGTEEPKKRKPRRGRPKAAAGSTNTAKTEEESAIDVKNLGEANNKQVDDSSGVAFTTTTSLKSTATDPSSPATNSNDCAPTKKIKLADLLEDGTTSEDTSMKDGSIGGTATGLHLDTNVDCEDLENRKPEEQVTLVAPAVVPVPEGKLQSDTDTSPAPSLLTEIKSLNILEGTLVAWDGPVSEPAFKRCKPKASKFYIVNCESKGEDNGVGVTASAPGIGGSVPGFGQLNTVSYCDTNGFQILNVTQPFEVKTDGTTIGEAKRMHRRRFKGPKKLQLVTKEEHHQILSTFVEDQRSREGGEMRDDENLSWLLDFKVDSLFPHQVDSTTAANNSFNIHGHHSNILALTDIANRSKPRIHKRTSSARPKLLQQPSTLPKLQIEFEPQYQQQQVEVSQVSNIICDNNTVHSVSEDCGSALVSFTVNSDVIDDVAGYELVESQEVVTTTRITSASANTANRTSTDIIGQCMEDSGIAVSQEYTMSFVNEDGDISMESSCYNDNDGLHKDTSSFANRIQSPSKQQVINSDIICDQTGKPRCTYTDLIEQALRQSNSGLTVSEIYSWISSNYPYFQANDDRWKNSVRHNLSINPYFKKGDKARNGAGHLWVISEEGKGIRPPIDIDWLQIQHLTPDISMLQRRRSGSDGISDSVCVESNIIPIHNETDRAISAILSQYAAASQGQQACNNNNSNVSNGDETTRAQSPATYIEISDGIGTSSEELDDTQGVSYNGMSHPTYTMSVHETHMEDPDMYNFDDFNPSDLIIINPGLDESNKENELNKNMEDVVTSTFNTLQHQSFDQSQEMTSDPESSAAKHDDPSQPPQSHANGSHVPMNQAVVAINTSIEDSHTDQHSSELTMLTDLRTTDQATMASIGMVTSDQHQAQSTQVVEIMPEDNLFDAKEMGMVYQYDTHGNPLFL